jgi:uncharacterized protein
MKTKLLILLTIFLSFSVQVFSQDRIVDNADLLSVSDKNNLINMINSVSAAYNFDLVIVTETDIGDTSPADYANDFFDYNGYRPDGSLFLRVMGTRDYWFSTSGRGIKILNAYAGQKLESHAGKYLGEDNYYAAFSAFIQDWDKFLGLEAKGRNYNFFYHWHIVLLVIAWLIALGIGFAVVHSWKRNMNTALPQTQAAAYVVSGSLNYAAKKDNFLYSKVNKTKRSSGGSSLSSSLAGGIRTGSSGRMHGGRGGRR